MDDIKRLGSIAIDAWWSKDSMRELEGWIVRDGEAR